LEAAGGRKALRNEATTTKTISVGTERSGEGGAEGSRLSSHHQRKMLHLIIKYLDMKGDGCTGFLERVQRPKFDFFGPNKQ